MSESPPLSVHPPYRRSRKVIAALCIALVASAGLAAWFFAELEQIPACDGGFEFSPSCPANAPGFFLLGQWGNGTKVNGTYTYAFLIEPIGPLNASPLAIRVFNGTTNTTAALANVSVYDTNSLLLATYAEQGGWWSTSSAIALEQVNVLVLTTLSAISGELLYVESLHSYTTWVTVR